MHLSPKWPAAPGGLPRSLGKCGLAALGLAALAPTMARAQTQDLFVTSSSSSSNTISRFAGTGPGTVSTTATPVTDPSLNNPLGLAFDARGDLFVANSGTSTITEFMAGSTPGTFGATTTLSGGGLSAPYGLAVDTKGDLFAANFGNFTNDKGSITEFAAGATPGTFLAGMNLTDPSLNNPVGVAVDARGDLFAANSGSGSGTTVTEFMAGATPGAFGATSTLNVGPISAPFGVAVDARGDLFVSDFGTNSITEFVTLGGGAFGPGTTFATGVSAPTGLAFDARGDLFVANYNGTNTGTITEFAFNSVTSMFGTAQIVETGLTRPTLLAFSPASPVPESSTTVSLGLLLALGMGGMVVAGKRKKMNGKAA